MKILYKFFVWFRNISFFVCAFLGLLGVVYDVFGIKYFMKIFNKIIPSVSYEQILIFTYVCLFFLIFSQFIVKRIEKGKDQSR